MNVQVKTCVLLAGLCADGVASVTEPVRSHDLTEIALREFGAEMAVERQLITVREGPSWPAASWQCLAIFPRRRSSLWRRCWCRVRASPSTGSV
jgi:hypothetical protein